MAAVVFRNEERISNKELRISFRIKNTAIAYAEKCLSGLFPGIKGLETINYNKLLSQEQLSKKSLLLPLKYAKYLYICFMMI
jgi:hypothetical protein